MSNNEADRLAEQIKQLLRRPGGVEEHVTHGLLDQLAALAKQQAHEAAEQRQALADSAEEVIQSCIARGGYSDLIDLTRKLAALASTTEATAEPMSDERIDAVSLAFWGGTQPGAMFNSFRAFARAILAEAGIKEKP